MHLNQLGFELVKGELLWSIISSRMNLIVFGMKENLNIRSHLLLLWKLDSPSYGQIVFMLPICMSIPGDKSKWVQVFKYRNFNHGNLARMLSVVTLISPSASFSTSNQHQCLWIVPPKYLQNRPLLFISKTHLSLI
jgi:hypothetical protein